MKSVKINSCEKTPGLPGFFRISRLIFILILSYAGFISAQSYPAKPDPPRLVNDLAAMMDKSEVAQLEQKLLDFNDSTSTQISIVTINNLDGADISQYAIELGEKWGIGRKQKDNGVLILVSKEDRKVFIATGRGVEEFLPDAICKRIVENRIKPAFRAGHYYAGLADATDEMIARLTGKFEAEETDTVDGFHGIPWKVIIIAILLLFILLPIIFGGRGGGGSTISGRGFRSFGGGPFFGGGFGGGSFGGGSSGGFGGFGGGGFGGGGAGGSW